MADIVERLRAQAPDGILASYVTDIPALREAADEIGRLRQFLATLLDGCVNSDLSDASFRTWVSAMARSALAKSVTAHEEQS